MGDKMSVSKSAIAEAIKAELARDQAELQEIQKRLVDLEERARVNRAWLKTYGFLETAAPEPAVQAETNLHLVPEPVVDNPAPVPTPPAVPPDASTPSVAAEPVPTVLKNEKNTDRKELYEALISRGARIG